MDGVEDDAQAVVCAWVLTSTEQESERSGAVNKTPENESKSEEKEEDSTPAGETSEEHYLMAVDEIRITKSAERGHVVDAARSRDQVERDCGSGICSHGSLFTDLALCVFSRALPRLGARSFPCPPSSSALTNASRPFALLSVLPSLNSRPRPLSLTTAPIQ